MNNSPHPHLRTPQHISTHLASSCCSAAVSPPPACGRGGHLGVRDAGAGRHLSCSPGRTSAPSRDNQRRGEHIYYLHCRDIYTVYISTLSRYLHIYVPSRVCTNTNTCVIVNRNMTIILKLNLNCVLEFKLIKILSPSDVTRANCMRLFKCSR